MNSIDILIEVEGTWCNDWPDLRVVVNNYTYIDQKIQDKKIFNFTVPATDSNVLVLEHHSKRFGVNGQWDTKADGNIILQDRGIKICRLELNDVDIVKYITRWPLITDSGDSIPTDYLGHNGQITIDFNSPVYDWIITHLVRENVEVTSTQDLIIETSHKNVFDYSEDVIELQEITKLLKTHAHLFNKSS